MVVTESELLPKEKKGVGEDRISELPDDVLCHILSFLPSNEAIATCLLSTRWRFLWNMVPALDFECKEEPTSHDRIDKFLSLRATQRITRFHLSCESESRYYVQKWVSAAIDGKVEQLNISLCGCRDGSILSLPTCATIVSLKLTGSYGLSLPSSVHLPSLKTLHLQVELFPFPDLKNLLYGSPALELFHLEQKWSYRIKELKIVRNSRGVRLLERIGMTKVMCDLVIQSGPNYDFIPYYLEDQLGKVVKAKVYITIYEHKYYFDVFPILKALRNVEFLSLSDFRVDMEDEDEDDDALDHLPQFKNLVQLQLSLKDTDSLFMELPAKCPKLKVAEFGIMDGHSKRCRYYISGGVWENDPLFSELEFSLLLFLVSYLLIFLVLLFTGSSVMEKMRNKFMDYLCYLYLIRIEFYM